MRTPILRALVVDDEALARARLIQLLHDTEGASWRVDEAAHAGEARACLRQQYYDVIFIDHQMPGETGLHLAQCWRQEGVRTPLVFVSAHTEPAVHAFDLQALDYLTKPVRLTRLQQTLTKLLAVRPTIAQVSPSTHAAPAVAPAAPVVQPAGRSLRVNENGRWFRLPMDTVLAVKAEQKFTRAFTATGSHLVEPSLTELETLHPDYWLRVHRHSLVARHALLALEKQVDASGAENWVVRLRDWDETLPVSRRQWGMVRAALAST